MSKHDLQARPIYHHKRESIEAHLTIVFAALAVSHWIETQTGWSIKKFVRTARRYRTVQIKVGQQTLTAADPLPDDLRDALATIGHGQCALIWPKSGRCWRVISALTCQWRVIASAAAALMWVVMGHH